jgi:hypothetical protein
MASNSTSHVETEEGIASTPGFRYLARIYHKVSGADWKNIFGGYQK